jgi:hypothetical protein
MKTNLLFIFICFVFLGFSQDIERTLINGKIIVSSEDKEGVAVFNTSSNKGTTTDEEGYFSINVALNDIIEFSALQFKDFTVKISEDIIRSKRLTVILVEEVNKLDEVVLLPFGLTGNINADLNNVRTYNVSLDYVYFGLDNITDFEFSPDYKTEAENVAFNEYNPRVDNMLNVVNLAGFLLKQVANVDLSKKTQEEKRLEITPFRRALEKYSYNYLHVNFDIPLDQMEDFIAFMETEGIADDLFAKDKEIQLLERINQLSQAFLNLNRERN